VPSILKSYTYDIFISYRQKDNKYNGWVTEFVNHLEGELASTFKEEVSIYFDENPYDGLLETHDVDESLKEKLKCLVFIPIISRTYCDPRSFAWEHELKAFAEQASEDQFGLKVRLPNGNVASRILPVLIHDLDNEDNSQCESVFGGVLRGIDFIYKETGVNRPLRADEEHPHDNLNKTYYRDQMNKVANAIREIITALKKQSMHREEIPDTYSENKVNTLQKQKTRFVVISIVFLAFIIPGILFVPKLFKSSEQLEKSIAVLPFDNLNSDEKQEWFSDGITDVIITQLSKVSDLRVIGRISTLKYKEEKKSISEIGKELGVNYIIEGTVQCQENKMRINVQLVRVVNEGHIWSDFYDREWNDIFDVQTDIAERIADALMTVLTPEEIDQINTSETTNSEAYNLYLQGRLYWYTRTEGGLQKSVDYFRKAITVDTNYALAYAGLADAFFIQAFWRWIPWESGTDSSKMLVLHALDIDKNLAEAHAVLGALYNYKEWKWEEAKKELQLAVDLKPGFVIGHHYYSELLDILRQNNKAREQINIALQLEPFLPVLHALSSGYYYNEGKLKESLDECRVLEELDPEYHRRSPYLRKFYIFYRQKDDLEALEALQKVLYMDTLKVMISNIIQDTYNESGMNGVLKWLIENELKKPVPDPISIARCFINIGNKAEALSWLEKAFDNRSPYLPEAVNNNPDYDILRSEPRFQALIEKMGLQNYQVPK
jgi:TolB-like protein/Tfp pilus assembly protein PilF